MNSLRQLADTSSINRGGLVTLPKTVSNSALPLFIEGVPEGGGSWSKIIKSKINRCVFV